MPNPSSVSEILDRVEELGKLMDLGCELAQADVRWLHEHLRAALQDVQLRKDGTHE